ncbi:hypothetical protein ACH3XW_38765 [Acanthocheilonema viteae]
MLLQLILLLPTCFISNFISAHACYYCVSYAHLLVPNLRYQLGAQTDIFYWPIDASSPSCSNPLLANYSHQIHAQICTKFPLCITLSPNIANVSFVVRGCMEQILVTKLRINEKFQKNGCYTVRSKQIHPSLSPLDYIICVCSNEYCNSDVQNRFPYIPESESLNLLFGVESERIAERVIAEIRNLATTLNPLPVLILSLFLISIPCIMK